MTLRFLPFLIALLSILAAATPVANAQNPSLSIQLDGPDQYALNAGQEETFSWTITAAGATNPITVTPAIDLPAPWTVASEPPLAPFTLGGPAGQNPTFRTFEVTLSLPTDAAERGVENGTMTLRASGQGVNTVQNIPPATQTIGLAYIAPPPAPVIPAPDYTWAWASGVVLAVLLVALAIYLFQARRIGVAVDSPVKRFNIGTGGAFKVTVSNPSRTPQNIQLRVTDLPKDWSAAFSFPVVPLKAHERSEVPLWVNVPLEASPNTRQSFRIQARPNRFSPWLVTKRLEADTLDVVIRPTKTNA